MSCVNAVTCIDEGGKYEVLDAFEGALSSDVACEGKGRGEIFLKKVRVR